MTQHSPALLDPARFDGAVGGRAVRLCTLQSPAGLRAAVLWRQMGGSRMDFLLRRRAMTEAAHRLLSPLD